MGDQESQKEQEQHEKYLVYPHELPAEYGAEYLVENKEVIPIRELRKILGRARTHIEDTPGPNQEFRRENTGKWLGWWENYLMTYDRNLRYDDNGQRLMTIEEVYSRALFLKREHGIDLANLFANSMEGHEGHRKAVAAMLTNTPPGVLPGLFIDSAIDPSKDRPSKYFPLGVVLSMWAYYRKEKHGRLRALDHICVIPEMPVGVDRNLFYWSIFFSSGAKYHYVVEGDRHFENKVMRNYGGAAILRSARLRCSVDNELVEQLISDWDEEAYGWSYLEHPADQFEELPDKIWMIIPRAGEQPSESPVHRTSDRIHRLYDDVPIGSEPITDYWEGLHRL